MDMKKMQSKALSDDQMENVTGGTYFDSMEVANFLQKAGYKDVIESGIAVKFDQMRNVIDKLGFESSNRKGIQSGRVYELSEKQIPQREVIQSNTQRPHELDIRSSSWGSFSYFLNFLSNLENMIPCRTPNRVRKKHVKKIEFGALSCDKWLKTQ